MRFLVFWFGSRIFVEEVFFDKFLVLGGYELCVGERGWIE